MYIKIGEQQILEAAKWWYGSGASLWPNTGHAFDWQAKKPGDSRRFNIGLQQWSDSKYSKDWRVTLTGPGRNDWAWFNPFKLDWAVVPVVLVPNELMRDAGLARGVSLYKQNLELVSGFYKQQIGRGFKVIGPQIWNIAETVGDIKRIYDDSTDRFDLFKFCQDKIRVLYNNRINGNLIFAVTQYTGNTPDWDYDAAGGGWLCTVSSFACCNLYDPTGSALEKTLGYALAHELGHCFGLGHTDKEDSNNKGFYQQVMLGGRPPDAGFTPTETQRLLANPFFKE